MKVKNDRLVAFNKNYILESADKLFVAQGLNNTSMDQIAREAKLTKPTLVILRIRWNIVPGFDFMKNVLDIINTVNHTLFRYGFREIGEELLA